MVELELGIACLPDKLEVSDARISHIDFWTLHHADDSVSELPPLMIVR
jgi:hypothetical protein